MYWNFYWWVKLKQRFTPWSVNKQAEIDQWTDLRVCVCLCYRYVYEYEFIHKCMGRYESSLFIDWSICPPHALTLSPSYLALHVHKQYLSLSLSSWWIACCVIRVFCYLLNDTAYKLCNCIIEDKAMCVSFVSSCIIQRITFAVVSDK